MKFHEFGVNNEKTILLLNGFGSCWARFTPLYHTLAKEYHVITDAYDGFNPEEPKTEFKSHFYEAICAVNYILERFDGKLDVLYACSFGNNVLFEILNDPRITVKHAIGDGMEFSDFFGKFKSEFAKRFISACTGSFFWFMVVKNIDFSAKLMGRTKEQAHNLVYEKATRRSYINADYHLVGYGKPFSVMNKTDFHVWYGENGIAERALSREVESLTKRGCRFSYKLMKGLGHGGLGDCPEHFLEEVNLVVKKEKQVSVN